MHSEPDLLALLALGEPAGTTQEREHLATCAYCTADLAALQRVVGLAREAADVTYVEPAPSVWAAVRAGVRASTKTPETAEPKAYARLTPVLEPWARASGEAELATDGSGRRLLQVTLRADLPATGLRQAWLVDRHDPTQRQSLGVLDGPHGLWTVGRAIDVEQYAILEISQEDVGSTQHSGHTIVRGELVRAA